MDVEILYEPDVWHHWYGGECPVPGTEIVEVTTMANLNQVLPAYQAQWEWNDENPAKNVVFFKRSVRNADTLPVYPVAPEYDPNGRSAHETGSKLDAGKNRAGLVLGDFARALREVSKVGTYGAQKYTDRGWVEVPDGINRYTDAMLRHWLAECVGESCDMDTELLHAAHLAWNALARLDLILRKLEQEAADVSP